jgi:Flp pilus assembly protein TadD
MVVFLCGAGCIWGDGAAAGAAQQAAPKGLEPVFPAENQNLTFVEAEDAVSTNFAREPVLNFEVSGFRALQLNRSSGLEGVGSFYADYVFTLPSAGTWELWYGGTPPGPKDELYPSYTSPFSVTIDAEQPRQVTRETVAVAGTYAPVFSWNLVGERSLEAGRHTIRFEITEKRRIDGRYFFYFDCFFLVKKEAGARLVADPLPAVFPADMDDRKGDAPFAAIDDMLIKVRDNPGTPQPLVDLAALYTLLGDYLNALKYLNRAAALRPHDTDILLLIAKNRIWKGDVPEGLSAYRAVLGQDPKRRELWLEAGKMAAWNGNYEQSIGFFRDALSAFPGDLDLTVNLGLTYLWAGRGQDAETSFRTVQTIAGADPQRLMDLGRVYRVNGYPDRALQAYTAAANVAPQNLEPHLLVIDTLRAMGRKADADAERKRLQDMFVPSDRLTAYLDSFQQAEGLKDQVIAEYEEKLKQNPDNLVLRQVLAQAYFWNGLKDKAVAEYRHILANYAYHSLTDAETKASPLPLLIDRGYLLSDYLQRFPGIGKQQIAALSAGITKVNQANSVRVNAQAALDAAQKAQAKAKEGKETDAALAAVQTAEDKLLTAENALATEKDGLSRLVDTAAALLAQVDQAGSTLQADAETARELSLKDGEAQATFTQATRANGWKFDRAGMLAEMAPDLAQNDLSRLVSAKIVLGDRMTTQAQTMLAPDAGSRSASSAAYTTAQSQLWAGQVKNALPLIQRLSDDPGLSQVPSYFADLAGLAAGLSISPEPAAQQSADPLADAKALAAQLAVKSNSTAVQRDALQKSQVLLHTLYRHMLVRALYGFEQEVFSLRNELGDYYLAGNPPALDLAIVQFKRVLAVDPGDLNAMFRLGKVYEWKRDWKSAQDAYGIVYKADPYFENVATLYNHVAREHADNLSSLTYATVDSQKVQWHAEATYAQSFDTTLGMIAEYQTDDWRIARGNDTGGTDSSAYQVHDVSFGIPVNMYLIDVKLTPWIGGMLVGDSLFMKTGSVTPPGDLFESIYASEPYAKLDVGAGAFNTLYLNGTLRWGRLPETLDPSRQTALYDASAEANLTTLLSFIDVWPLRDTTLRTYGRVDIVQNSGFVYQNLMYTALQEITINILKGGSPYGVLALTGNVTWQNSDQVEPYLYYTPVQVLIAGASLTGSIWIGAKNGDVLGLSLRGYGGSYQDVEGGVPVSRVKGEGEADVSLTSGDATWSLTMIGNATYNLGGAAQPWDYWSLFLRLGYSLKLPGLLAP